MFIFFVSEKIKKSLQKNIIVGKLLWEVSFTLMSKKKREKEVFKWTVRTLFVLGIFGLFVSLFLSITTGTADNGDQTSKVSINKNSPSTFPNINSSNSLKHPNINQKIKKNQDETLSTKGNPRENFKKNNLSIQAESNSSKKIDNNKSNSNQTFINTSRNIDYISKIPDVENLYIAFFENKVEHKSYSEREFKKFNELTFGVPVSLLPLIAIDDPQIKDLLTEKNNPFREIIEENQKNTDKTVEAQNAPPENTQNNLNEDQNQIAGNTENQSSSSSDSGDNLGDYSSNDSSPVNSGQSDNSNSSNLPYLKGIIVYNNGQKLVKSKVDFVDDHLILDGATIPCSFMKFDGVYLIENQISIYDINGDYFSDYVLLNKKEGNATIFLNFFNEFIFDKNLFLGEKIVSCCCFKMEEDRETILCGLSRNTNELLFYKLYPNTLSQMVFKTGLLNRYSGILSDDFNNDGFEDLLLSEISKNKYLYLKNIGGKEISPFLTNIPFTRPPAVLKIYVKKDDSIEFTTFETKNSMDIFLNENNLPYLICSMKNLSMDVFILISDFNNDGVPDLGIGHF